VPSDEAITVPVGQLTAILPTRTAGVCHRDGTWSAVVYGPAVTHRSLDDALASLLRSRSAATASR